jgi:hypothetical protein
VDRRDEQVHERVGPSVACLKADHTRPRRNQFGGMKADDVKRRRELERENQRLKRIVVNQALDIDGLREIARGDLVPGQDASRYAPEQRARSTSPGCGRR